MVNKHSGTIMANNSRANKDTPTVGTRLPRDEVALLDVARERAGDPDKATTIRRAIRAEIERWVPGAFKEAA